MRRRSRPSIAIAALAIALLVTSLVVIAASDVVIGGAGLCEATLVWTDADGDDATASFAADDGVTSDASTLGARFTFGLARRPAVSIAASGELILGTSPRAPPVQWRSYARRHAREG
jgi:hypothetical protein